MEEGCVTINQVPTRVITFGGWIDKPVRNNKLVLMITGNPGVIGYYEEFLHALYEELDGCFSVWGLGHAGHQVLTENQGPCVRKNPDLFNLDGQVRHKVAFVEEHIPKDTELHIVGHSIGAKICIDLVHKFQSSHTTKGYLLFPTIERMAQTPNGRRLWPILGPLRRVVVFAASLVNLIPENWLLGITSWFLKSVRCRAIEGSPALSTSIMPDRSAKATVQLLKPSALECSLFMAHDELQVVCELDADRIRRLQDRLTFYFGTTDEWCPLEYYENLKRLVPETKAYVCNYGMQHAFVLQSSRLMANLVSQWILSS